MTDLTPVRIHILDTPGYPDYLGQDMSALDAVKSVCAVIDPTKGPELLTRRLMAMAKERGLCRMIVINHMDDPEADLENVCVNFRKPGDRGCCLLISRHATVRMLLTVLTAKTATATS